jgi:hypothetical protein
MNHAHRGGFFIFARLAGGNDASRQPSQGKNCIVQKHSLQRFRVVPWRPHPHIALFVREERSTDFRCGVRNTALPKRADAVEKGLEEPSEE